MCNASFCLVWLPWPERWAWLWTSTATGFCSGSAMVPMVPLIWPDWWQFARCDDGAGRAADRSQEQRSASAMTTIGSPRITAADRRVCKDANRNANAFFMGPATNCVAGSSNFPMTGGFFYPCRVVQACPRPLGSKLPAAPGRQIRGTGRNRPEPGSSKATHTSALCSARVAFCLH